MRADANRNRKVSVVRGGELKSAKDHTMRHPQYYLGRAEESRIIAEATVNLNARQTLLECAAEYEDLARLATVQKSAELADKVKKFRTHAAFRDKWQQSSHSARR